MIQSWGLLVPRAYESDSTRGGESTPIRHHCYIRQVPNSIRLLLNGLLRGPSNNFKTWGSTAKVLQSWGLLAPRSYVLDSPRGGESTLIRYPYYIQQVPNSIRPLLDGLQRGPSKIFKTWGLIALVFLSWGL